MSDQYFQNLQLSLKIHNLRLSSDLRSRAERLLAKISAGEKSEVLLKTVRQLRFDADRIDLLGVMK